ncbi:MAG: hypothetical protein MZU95_05170 [Desulfomicrobium escambiense]|nr:hypothetical protein [Desulfomicrobium escambiense]
MAMLVSNEIERPITVDIRPRKSRHGGVSTQIVIKEKAAAAGTRASRGAEKEQALPRQIQPEVWRASPPGKRKQAAY